MERFDRLFMIAMCAMAVIGCVAMSFIAIAVATGHCGR